MSLPRNVTGTSDYFGVEAEKLEYIFDILSSIFVRHGFKELRTPAFEYFDLVKKSYGGECDKLIYHVLDTNINFTDEVLSKIKESGIGVISKKCLRYDLTLPLIRYVYKNINKINFPFKRFQIQPVWRADRPQKGRFREFFQCDIDIVGSDSLLCEAELIQIITEGLNKLGLINYKIRINSRKILNDICKLLGIESDFREFCVLLDKIDKIGVDSFIEGVSKLNISEDKIDILKKILEYKDNIGFLEELFLKNDIDNKNLIELYNLKKTLVSIAVDLSRIEIDFSLARGLDYYTGIVYEAEVGGVKIGSIVGGGRYNYFGERFGSEKLNGVGVSFGIQRIFTALEELCLFEFNSCLKNRILITNLDGKINAKYINILRDKYIVELYYNQNDNLRTQLKFANKNNFDYVLIGDSIRNMETGEQINFADFINAS